MEQELSELVTALKTRKSQLEEAIAAVQSFQMAGTLSIREIESVLQLTGSGRQQAATKRVRDYWELRQRKTPA